MVVALRGWFDVAEVATGALEHLVDDRVAPVVASIDPDPFFDFTQERPEVYLDDDDVAPGPVAGQRVPRRPLRRCGRTTWCVLAGVEPHLRYATFADSIITVARTLGCEVVVTVGAAAEAVPHTRLPQVVGSSTNDGLVRRARAGTPAVPGDDRAGRRAAGAARPQRASPPCRCASACRTTSATPSTRSRRRRCCATSSTCSACPPVTPGWTTRSQRWRSAARRGRRRGSAGRGVRGDARARVRSPRRGRVAQRRRPRRRVRTLPARPAPRRPADLNLDHLRIAVGRTKLCRVSPWRRGSRRRGRRGCRRSTRGRR